MSCEWFWKRSKTPLNGDMTITMPEIDFSRKGATDPLAALSRRTKRIPHQAYPLKLLGVPGAATNHYGLDVVLGVCDEAPDEKEMSVWINFADGNKKDGVGDILEIGGIDTERHRKNPIVLFDHGKEVKLPVALAEDPKTLEYTVTLDPISKVGKAKAFFYRGTGLSGVTKSDEYDHAVFCEQLFDLICKRYIRAGSIGYQVKSAEHLHPYERDDKGNPVGLHLLSVLMLECSAVVLPANQDTTRKALCLDKVCGKSLSPYLVKSLSGYLPENTSVSVAIPHGNLSDTSIPPPKARAGWVDLKGFVEKLTNVCQTFSDIEGMESFFNRIFTNPVDRHVYWVGEIGGKQLDEVKKRLKDTGLVKKFTKSLGTYPQGIGWKVFVKGSYFENCPRDETGHCKPRQAVGEEHGDRKPNKPPKVDNRKRHRNDTSAAVANRGEEAPAAPREEVWAKGKLGLLVVEGVVEKSGDPSIQPGTKVTEDFLIKNGWKRVEPRAAPTDDNGTEGKSMSKDVKKKTMPENKAKGKAMPPPKETPHRSLPPNAPPVEEEITEDVQLTADPASSTPVDPAVDVTKLEAQDDLEGPNEPYGAGVMRQLYKDHQILMEDYHKIMQALDNPSVYRLLEKKLMLFEKTMSEIEQLFEQNYGGRGLKGLAEEELDAVVGDVDATGSNPALEDAELAADEAGAAADAQFDPMGDDEGTPADSDAPEEVVDPAEVGENMRRPDIKGIKSIRHHYRQKALMECKCGGGANCKCGKSMTVPKKVMPENAGSPTNDVTGDLSVKSDDAFTETGEPGHKDLDSRERKWLDDTLGFLKNLADESKYFDEETRLECKGWHKLMNEVGDMSAHFRTKPKKKMAGDLEWLQEEEAEEEHREHGEKRYGTTPLVPSDSGQSAGPNNPSGRGHGSTVGARGQTGPSKMPKRPDAPNNWADVEAEAAGSHEPLSDAGYEDEGPIDLADLKSKELSLLRSLCKDAADYLDAMSREKAFGASHRNYAATLVKAFEDALTKAVPDQSDDPTPVDEQESLVALSGTDVDVDGIKSLNESQSKQLETLTKQLELVVSAFGR